MEKIFCGTSGIDKLNKTHKLSDIPTDEFIKSAIIHFYGSDITLRPAQDIAIYDYAFLTLETNFIIATPTNSGKSLLSYLIAFREAFKGKKAIIIEPLRALAYEKAEELKAIASLLKKNDGRKVKISITTGDYRLNDEFMSTRPDEPGRAKEAYGEIVIATPERIDAISRVKDNLDWFSDVSLVCIDEAHLLGDPHRGATLELLIAFLRAQKNAIQLVLMSATISNTGEIADWLNPCEVISNIPRYPTLERWLYNLADEDVNEVVIQETKELLKDDDNNLIIFVYRTDWAESLAHKIAEELSGKRIRKNDLTAAIETGVAWYHANLSSGTKVSIRQAILDKKVRVVVSTTALSMGINLPATHVIVRDITFSGYKALDMTDLTQMMGRAGRGNKAGVGIVLLRSDDSVSKSELEKGLNCELCPRVSSQLVPASDEGYYGKKKDNYYYLDRIGNQVIGIINRIAPVTYYGLEGYLSKTLGGQVFLPHLDEILFKLSQWKLVFKSEETNEYDLTSLGKTASRCYIPPITTANIGQLIRDLLQDESDGGHITQFRPIDILIMLCLTSSEIKPIVRYSKAIESKITNYMESLPMSEKSYLYRTWIVGSAELLLGSSRIDISYKGADAHKVAHQLTYTAMLIYDLSKGIPVRDLQSWYGLNIDEIEEKLRDTVLWLLYGLEKIFDIRNFYYHLKSNCEVEYDSIRSVENTMKRVSSQIFGLIANLRYRSSLGELIRGIKRTYPKAKSYPGEGTIRRMEEGGITSLKDLVNKSVLELTELGVNRAYAELIVGYIQRRRA